MRKRCAPKSAVTRDALHGLTLLSPASSFSADRPASVCAEVCPTLYGIAHHTKQHKRYVMGVTSLWLLMPIAFACGSGDLLEDNFSIGLAMWSAAACLVSTLCYRSFDTVWEEKFVLADKACAHALFVCLLLYFGCSHAARSVSTVVQIALPLCVVFFYSCSRFFELIRKHEGAATLSHVAFRYVGYWWVYLALVPASVEPLGFAFTFLIDSIFYWSHIVCTMVRSGRDAQFHVHAHYIGGCMQLLSVMSALVAAHVGLLHLMPLSSSKAT